jgi:hypothetical protein
MVRLWGDKGDGRRADQFDGRMVTGEGYYRHALSGSTTCEGVT